MKAVVIASLSILICMSCSTKRQKEETPKDDIGRFEYTAVRQMPSVFIYKTKQDYNKQVPVMLNEDKTKIVSYPAPSDVCPGGECAYPTPLTDGYLLDNRGIGLQVAFLSYTYEEYAALQALPSTTELLSKIIDKNPLLELYSCGRRTDFTDMVKELNSLIRQGKHKKLENLVKISH